MRIFVVIVVLALAGGGCVTSSTVTEGDRQVVHQSLGALDVAIGRLEAIEGAVADQPSAAEALQEATVAIADVRENAAHLLAIFGPPENPKPWSLKDSKNARDQSGKDHAGGGGFWYWLLGGLGAVGTAAWAVIRTTVAGQAVDVLVKAGQQLREKAAAGPLTADDVKATYKDVVAIAPEPVKKRIEETLVRVKTVIPAAAPAEPAPSTTPTPRV